MDKGLKNNLNYLFSSMQAHAYFKDKNGVYINCSESFAKIAGISRDDIVGKSDLDLPWKDQANMIRRTDLEVLKNGNNLAIEEMLMLANGDSNIFLTNKTAIKENNKTIGIIAFLSDITQRKHYENKLKLSEYKANIALENILNNIPAHIFWKDRNCILLGCNDLQAKHMGYSSGKELIGKSNYDVIWPEQSEEERKRQADEITKLDLEVMNTGRTQTAEEPLVLPDGNTAIYLSKKTPLRNHEGEIIGLLGIAFDITSQKESESLKIEREILERQLAMVKTLAATIAHELRTPLAAIFAGAEGTKDYLPDLINAYQLAKEHDLPVSDIRPSQVKLISSAMDEIIDETKYSNIIINMLLTNVDQKSIDPSEFQLCSISQCINAALQRYPFQSEERKFIEWENKDDFSFIGKEILTVHIFFNLLKNAIYFVKASHKEKRDIRIWLAKSDTYNKVHFRDSGKGIPTAILPKIFDLFFSNRHHGSGVGLAFCKMVMESYGGKIECESIEGEFTEFILSFPVTT